MIAITWTGWFRSPANSLASSAYCTFCVYKPVGVCPALVKCIHMDKKTQWPPESFFFLVLVLVSSVRLLTAGIPCPASCLWGIAIALLARPSHSARYLPVTSAQHTWPQRPWQLLQADCVFVSLVRSLVYIRSKCALMLVVGLFRIAGNCLLFPLQNIVRG
jgi:hypothetical protein